MKKRNGFELTAVVLLRCLGVSGMLAAVAVFMPFSWMQICHEWLGMGELPDAPIVSYLSRSLSAFYVWVGAFVLLMSFDLAKYRHLIRLWGLSVCVVGVVAIWVDLASGLPSMWTWSEGPPMLIIGPLIVYCERRFQD